MIHLLPGITLQNSLYKIILFKNSETYINKFTYNNYVMYTKTKDIHEDSRKTKKENRDRILEILTSLDLISATRLRKKSGLSAPVFAKHMKQLVDREKIVGVKTDENDHRKRYYFLNEIGYTDEAVIEEIRRFSLLMYLIPIFEKYQKTKNKKDLERGIGRAFLTVAKEHFTIFEIVPQLIRFYGYPEDKKIKKEIGYDRTQIHDLIGSIRKHTEKFGRLKGEDVEKLLIEKQIS